MLLTVHLVRFTALTTFCYCSVCGTERQQFVKTMHRIAYGSFSAGSLKLKTYRQCKHYLHIYVVSLVFSKKTHLMILLLQRKDSKSLCVFRNKGCKVFNQKLIINMHSTFLFFVFLALGLLVRKVQSCSFNLICKTFKDFSCRSNIVNQELLFY